MSKYNKLPGKAVTKKLEERLARYDRGPFQSMLADALAVKPSLTAWRKLAARSPERYVAAVTQLAKPSGFGERSESIQVKANLSDLASTLVARHGEDKAGKMLSLFGLPAELAQNRAESTIIEAEATHVETEKTPENSPESATE